MKQILSFIKTYVILVILFVVQKPLFLLLEKSSTAPQTINIWGLYASGNLAWVVA